MYNGTNESDQVVRLVLSGSVFMLRVSGQASMELLKFIAAAASDESKATGKVRLKSLLQSGSELKVFTLQGDDRFDAFKEAAKDYGVKYSVVKRNADDKNAGIYDIMVKAEDASKINRIIEKYSLVEISASVQASEGGKENERENGRKNGRQTDHGKNNMDVAKGNDSEEYQTGNRQLPEDSQFESIADIRDLLGRMLTPAAMSNPMEASEREGSLSDAYLMNERHMHQPDKERKSVVKELEEMSKESEAERSKENSRIMDEEAVQNFMKSLLGKESEKDREEYM
ncbi:MAG: PcfB family protein [Eubacterium sp.]|nr:PcfB family protein [Eubacterium sp.]